ncbi:MAG: lysylphosphatidylglycerol synthase transmembrane domain-containing protein [Candidatus Wallbacteria bacterium]|nr:lysylphosphatidylglycerol synthase transmembrane domain-containing protein [Candidatus Wallbacteria bacterium]
MALKIPNLRFPLYKLIGFGILCVILYRLDFKAYAGSWQGINSWMLVLSLLPLFFQIWLKALRWRMILTDFDRKASESTMTLFRYYLAGLFFGIVTPGRLGDLLKFRFLISADEQAFTATLVDRLWDFGVLCVFGCVSVALFMLPEAGINPVVASCGVIIAVASILAVFSQFYRREDKMNKCSRKGGPETSGEPQASGCFDRLRSMLNSQTSRFGLTRSAIPEPGRIFEYSCLTVFSMLAFILRIHIITFSTGAALSFSRVFLVCSAVSMAVLIPVSVAGLGTREAAVVLLFQSFGKSPASGLFFSNLMFISGLVDTLISYLVYLSLSGDARTRGREKQPGT